MSRLRPLVAAIAATCFFAFPAAAKLLIEIDKSAQRMIVSQDGARLHVWPVSTGLRAHDTPAGSFTPFRMEKDHFSREWDDAPMPHSIFFTRQGHAIHGTEHRRRMRRAIQDVDQADDAETIPGGERFQIAVGLVSEFLQFRDALVIFIDADGRKSPFGCGEKQRRVAEPYVEPVALRHVAGDPRHDLPR